MTSVTKVQNRSRFPVWLLDVENPEAEGHGAVVPAGGEGRVRMWVPWATAADFSTKHLELVVDGVPRYWIWQALNADGDHVRYSSDGFWHDRGEPVDGISLVDGDRTLVVFDGGFQLIGIPEDLVRAVRSLLDTAHYRMVPNTGERSVPSNPKSAAVAFSVAGPASDQGNCVYRDSGKRYEFAIENGVVFVTPPNGARTPLTDAISFSRKRAGERHTAPAFDLLAASGGRVFAKARGSDSFYFATMDRMFMHCRAGRVMSVPSTYFKLDPEHNQPGRRTRDLLAHLEGSFAGHPAAELFPPLRVGLEQEAVDMMVVRVKPRLWHLLDPRPPIGLLDVFVAVVHLLRRWLSAFLEATLPVGFGDFEGVVDALDKRLAAIALLAEQEAAAGVRATVAPPSSLPSYDHVVYREERSQAQIALQSIDYRRVLDIGVGHVHWHEQYEGITGGEIQPMLMSEARRSDYQLFNGPIYDGDGYIDGTCNFYALVELAPKADSRQSYALLYQDEQSYFTERWRLVHPEDREGLITAVVRRLADPVYGFEAEKFWCPFRGGRIGPKSRLAVAAQVLLVTENAAGTGDRRDRRLFSINFSWSTIDRTWRWRELPTSAETRYLDAAAEEAGTEPVGPSSGDTIYPQTIRLREDMTLHLKGTRRVAVGQDAVVGRWYQRYLPASNRLVPEAGELVPNQAPARGYSHPWKFLPEAVFQLADRFSHFGIYDTVDSRTQYYEIEPATDADAEMLRRARGGSWLDVEYRLYRWAPKLTFAAPLHLFTPSNLVPGVLDRRPPSLFNRETRLRIVNRRGRWIAMHWDKRDDDLLEFSGLPVQIRLTNGELSATVTLRSHHQVDRPPAIQRAELRWRSDAAVLVLVPAPPASTVQDLWRIRVAALVPGRPGQAVRLLEIAADRLVPAPGGASLVYRWVPSQDQVEEFRRYCTAAGAATYGTSIWFEDIVGHVSVPDEVRWLRSSTVVTVEPLPLPLGVPVGVVVRAVDEGGVPVEGRVLVDGDEVGVTNRVFSFTFETHTEERPGPKGEGAQEVEVEPKGLVRAVGFVDAPVPFSFYRPKLHVWVQPSRVPVGRAVELTVGASDERTRAAVKGDVLVGGQRVGETNVAFRYAVAAGGARGVVSAPGYDDVPFTVEAAPPSQLAVAVEPLPLPLGVPVEVTVRAVDLDTNVPIDGSVVIDDEEVARTNTRFTFTFETHTETRPGPKGEGEQEVEVKPKGIVRAPGYSNASLPLRFS